MKRILKIGGGIFLSLILLTILGIQGFKMWADARYYQGYDPDAPLHVQVADKKHEKDFDRVKFYFDGVDGIQVPALMTIPVKGKRPYPCVIFLHGIGQKKEFLDQIAPMFIKAGFAIVTFDQYTRGERKLKDASRWEEALALRRRGALTCLETRRLVDYLDTQDYIDANRIYLVGASYGAIMGATAVAMEPRIKAAVLTYGGGNLRKLADSTLVKEELKGWYRPAVWLFSWFLKPCDPEKTVGKISPRPVLLQNGKRDTIVPVPAAEVLQKAAGEPKTVIWYDSDHVGMDKKNTVDVLNDAIAWLRGVDVEQKRQLAASREKKTRQELSGKNGN